MNFKINNDVFNKFPFLETDNLLLENFQLTDALELFKIRSDKYVLKFLDRDLHKTVEESEKMIEVMHQSFKDKAGINWIIREKAKLIVIGYVGFWRLNREGVRAEIGYALKPEFWRKGLMSEAILRIIQFGFNEFGLHSIEGNVNPNNKRSIKLLEKHGFKKEAHFTEDYFYSGKYFDSAVYSLLETDMD